MAAKRGIFVAPFDELADPHVTAGLAANAEERGFDGFFVWDHITYRAPTSGVADPWVTLSAVACATERVRIGPLVTPLARRRPQKLARETVTLDHLSRGRLVFGAGLGGDKNGEFGPFGDSDDPRERARLLDEGLDKLAAYWSGEFQPTPLQQPRIPVWIAGRWPKRRPLQRAARWDGFFPIDMTDPAQLAELASEVTAMREGSGPFDIVAEGLAGSDPGPWEEAGATWFLTSFGQTPTVAEVSEAIEAGP